MNRYFRLAGCLIGGMNRCCRLAASAIGDIKWSCGFTASVSGDIKWSCILASPSFSGDKKRGGPVAGAPLIIMQ